MSDQESLIKFPCDFVIKVMGKDNSQFDERVKNILLRHYPDVDLSKIEKRHSRDKNFLALTFTIHANSKEELDALYQELSEAKEVLFAL